MGAAGEPAAFVTTSVPWLMAIELEPLLAPATMELARTVPPVMESVPKVFVEVAPPLV